MFILQYDKKTNCMSADVATAAEMIQVKAWINNQDLSEIMRVCDYEDVSFSETDIPVGSIEFCERVLGKKITPINIPPCLWEHDFTGRTVGIVNKPTLVREICAHDRLFIKSATKCKADYCGVYHWNDKIPNDDLYFFSTVVNPIAEWRCFVWNGKLLDIRRYLGDFTTTLTEKDIKDIKNMIQTIDRNFKNTMPAYTIDIARLEESDDIVIMEVHNFVACGLYGFEQMELVPMLIAGIKTERSGSHAVLL